MAHLQVAYPCGTTYGVEVDLPVQKGDLEVAKKMIQEAGYNGQKAVIINLAAYRGRYISPTRARGTRA